MDKDLKTKWLNALRSNKFIQGRARLEAIRSGVVKNCCLGVLCRVAGIEPELKDNEYEFDGECTLLSLKLLKQFKLSILQQNFLTNVNDGWTTEFNKRWSFEEIAQWIETNIEEEV